jgi:NAD(P)H-dependent FMN reductase
MKKILAFGASNSRQSINKKFAKYASSQIEDAEIIFLDLNDFEMPIFSVDIEKENGIPEPAKIFKNHIKEADGILISFAEHNGSYTAAFKNLFDWTSRVEARTWWDKPMFLMATSPGKRGGKSVLDAAINRFKYMNGIVVATFSLPSFNDNFSVEDGILDEHLAASFRQQLDVFVQSMS